MSERVYTRANWDELMNAIRSGQRVEIDEQIWQYFLDVLPPIFMRRPVKLVDGSTVIADYGFVEGADQIRAFWREHSGVAVRYFAQLTTLFSRG